MTIKDSTWAELNIVKTCKYKILRLRQQLEELEAVACSAPALSAEGSGGPASGVGDRTGSYAIKIVTLRQQIMEAQDEMANSMDRLDAKIGRIKNEKERFVLHSRFIGGRKMEDIADDLERTKRHTYRIYKKALSDFEECH